MPQTKRNMPSPQVNGDVPHAHSAFLDHITSYPLVNDSIETFKSNPYGKRSLELGDSAYRTFAAPFLSMLSRPYQYVSPYVKKADDLGDKTLCKVDEKFPIVKKPTNELVNDAKTIINFPIRIGQTGKEHVLDTYEAEVSRAGGNSDVVRYSKAAFSAALILSTETFTTIVTFMSSKGNEARQAADEKISNNQ
ncbi:hypothetical protein B0T22DRAFT_263467 [Podospora appendiculata]|uniref:Perilipin MPL1-like protein n=1 Tax=Podospora appendiculata TaxID=314037 RepID=A0AAE1C960_9PEZI|nr:hypothetical protein B0T22DRAFT_263467 [Podospora appendiculata]